MQAEIISIGDEITSGQLLDTNSQWLSQRLAEMGVRVLYHTACGDEVEPLAGVFRHAMERADVVISTGGLGPTADDLTREAVAKAAGRKLLLDRKVLQQIEQMYLRRKRPMPKRNELQAMFPQGSRVVPNPHGTAPGIDLELPRAGKGPSRLFALPGVPAEMRQMWSQTVAGALRKAGAGQRVILHRNIHCFGAGESQVEAMLPDLIRRGRKPTVGINASKATIILRITAEGATEEECQAAMEPTAETIYRCLGDLVYGEGDDGLEHALTRLLRQRGKSLATVEWGTGGLVADWLGDVTEAQGFYLGGMIVTDDVAVRRALHVPAELLAGHTSISREVAESMAAGCRTQFGADFGLAVGRFPKLDPDAPKPYYIALATSGGVRVKKILYAGHPALLKILAAKHALNLVRLEMLKKE